MVLPQSVAPSAILRRSSTRFNLAVRDMTIRRAQSPSRCSPLWRRSNSSPDRPAKTAARTHDESCYELVSLNCAVSQNCAPPPPDGLRQNKDEGAARPDDRVRVPRRVRPLPSLFQPFGQRSLSANCVEKLCLIEAPALILFCWVQEIRSMMGERRVMQEAVLRLQSGAARPGQSLVAQDRLFRLLVRGSGASGALV
jgi:hypothetical protein